MIYEPNFAPSIGYPVRNDFTGFNIHHEKYFKSFKEHRFHSEEVTCKNPVDNDSLINAKLFVNDELVKEYKIQQ